MSNHVRAQQTLSLFDRKPAEKGAGEWQTFTSVSEDRVGIYRVAEPKKTIVVRGPRNFLRIITPPRPRKLRSAL